MKLMCRDADDQEGIQTMCKIFEDYGKEVAQEVTKNVTKETLLTSVKALMKNLGLTVEQAMDALSIPHEERSDIKKMIALS